MVHQSSETYRVSSFSVQSGYNLTGVVALEVYSRSRQQKGRDFLFVRTIVSQGGDLWDDVSKLIEMLSKFGTPK